MPADYERLKIKDLKEICKKRGCSGTGEKGILIWRINLSDRVIASSLQVNGVSPFALNAGELKKVSAQNGISPMLTPDEMLEALVKILETKKGTADSRSSQAAASDSSSGSSSSGPDPIALARRVLELAELDDDEAILNLASRPGESRITRQSPVAVMRKAYLKLSLVLHPDKLSRVFDRATTVFQAVVRAFERCSSPDIVDAEAGRGNAQAVAKTIARSNDGCHRTRVCCPRCKVPWSENTLDGNPEYFYNFLMMGLKRFTCSTCLCEFGCMTGLHKCPHCKALYEYSPADYHRKIECGSTECGKKFGFYMFHTSERVMKELKTELKMEVDRAMKIREGKMRRAARAGSRGGSVDEEQAFLFGLSDTCPRCGDALEEYGEEEQRKHLMCCTDESKHKQHAKAKADKAAKAEALQKGALEQEAAEREATFQFLGARTDHLYLLDTSQVQKHAAILGVKGAESKSKDELIYTIASSSKRGCGGALLIEDSSSALVVAGSETSTYKRQRVDPASLPRNLHSMSESQVRSVCASHGIFVPSAALKIDMIDALEGACYDAHTAGGGGPSTQVVVIDDHDE